VFKLLLQVVRKQIAVAEDEESLEPLLSGVTKFLEISLNEFFLSVW
jgi:hypothetical protein